MTILENLPLGPFQSHYSVLYSSEILPLSEIILFSIFRLTHLLMCLRVYCIHDFTGVKTSTKSETLSVSFSLVSPVPGIFQVFNRYVF